MTRRPKPSGHTLPDKGHPLGQRRVGGRALRPRWLVVCEGAKTEPNYFRQFLKAQVEVVGAGADPSQVVAQALRLKKAAHASRQPYDEIWVVFDRDDFAHFASAIQQALANGLRVAYSNEAFELWYVLHFHYLDTGVGRTSYISTLTECLGGSYKKNVLEMYTTLLPRQPQAIRHARRLWEVYQPDHHPDRDNPCTTVFQLVEALNALPD